jgi:hypothetical protein
MIDVPHIDRTFPASVRTVADATIGIIPIDP